MYVCNYSMYGAGFDHPGFDLCRPQGPHRPQLRLRDRYPLAAQDRVIEVGEVPKYLAITPNGRTMLVGNWCSWDISVVDLQQGRGGPAHRGRCRTARHRLQPQRQTAYVTLVGEDRILVIDMKTFRVKRDIVGIGERPRHLVMSADGRYLYITVAGPGLSHARSTVRSSSTTRASAAIVARSKPLVEPRTTVMSDDGRSLYVVDYYPGTIVKLGHARPAAAAEHVRLGHHPIGVTYDNADRQALGIRVRQARSGCSRTASANTPGGGPGSGQVGVGVDGLPVAARPRPRSEGGCRSCRRCCPCCRCADPS